MDKIDIFGSQILFRFQKQKRYQTRIGGFITFAIISIIIIRLILIWWEVYTRESPNVISKERQVVSPQKYIFDKKNTQFAFGMQDPTEYYQFLDPQIYNIQVLQITQTNIKNTETGKIESKYSQREIKSGVCQSDYFSNPSTKDKFETLNYQNLYCIDPSEEIIIEGDYGQDTFNYAVIKISKCTVGCKSDKELEYYLLNGYFSIYFADITIDPVIKDEPFVFFNRDLFWLTSTNTAQNLNMYFRNSYVESDFGWVTSDLQTTRYPQFSYSDLSNAQAQNVDYFLQVVIRFEKSKENLYQRRYQTITDIISSIGGFAQSLIGFGFLLCSYFSELSLNKSLINDAFNFKFQRENNESQELKQQQGMSQKFVTQENAELKEGNYSINKTGINKNVKESVNKIEINNQDLITTGLMKVNSPNHEKYEQKQERLINQEVTNKDEKQNRGKIEKKNQDQTGNRIEKTNEQQGVKTQNQMENNGKNIENSQQNNHNFKQLNQSQFQKSYTKNQIYLSKVLSKKNNEESMQMSLYGQENKEVKSPTKVIKNKQAKKSENIENQIKKMLNQERGIMEMSFFEYLKLNFWPFNKEIQKKKKIIDYSVNKLYYHIDLLHIIQKLIEVDKLKKLLMDDDQIKLFEYLPKPTIYEQDVLNKEKQNQENDPSKQDIYYQDLRSESQKLQDAYQSYVKISKREQMSRLDLKILKNIDKNLVKIFQIAEENIQQKEQIPNFNHKNSYEQNKQIDDINLIKSQNILSQNLLLKNETDSNENQNNKDSSKNNQKPTFKEKNFHLSNINSIEDLDSQIQIPDEERNQKKYLNYNSNYFTNLKTQTYQQKN